MNLVIVRVSLGHQKVEMTVVTHSSQTAMGTYLLTPSGGPPGVAEPLDAVGAVERREGAQQDRDGGPAAYRVGRPDARLSRDSSSA